MVNKLQILIFTEFRKGLFDSIVLKLKYFIAAYAYYVIMITSAVFSLIPCTVALEVMFGKYFTVTHKFECCVYSSAGDTNKILLHFIVKLVCIKMVFHGKRRIENKKSLVSYSVIILSEIIYKTVFNIVF